MNAVVVVAWWHLDNAVVMITCLHDQVWHGNTADKHWWLTQHLDSVNQSEPSIQTHQPIRGQDYEWWGVDYEHLVTSDTVTPGDTEESVSRDNLMSLLGPGAKLSFKSSQPGADPWSDLKILCRQVVLCLDLKSSLRIWSRLLLGLWFWCWISDEMLEK